MPLMEQAVQANAGQDPGGMPDPQGMGPPAGPPGPPGPPSPQAPVEAMAEEEVSEGETMARQSLVESGDAQSKHWEEAPTEQEQAEFENAVGAMAEALYSQDGVFKGLMQMVSAEDSRSGIIKATATLITEVDKKVDFPEVVIPGLPAQAFDMIHEMAVESGAMEQLTEEEEKSAMSAAQQMVLQAYGGDLDDFNTMTQGLTEKDVGEMQSSYNEATQGHGFSK